MFGQYLKARRQEEARDVNRVKNFCFVYICVIYVLVKVIQKHNASFSFLSCLKCGNIFYSKLLGELIARVLFTKINKFWLSNNCCQALAIPLLTILDIKSGNINFLISYENVQLKLWLCLFNRYTAKPTLFLHQYYRKKLLDI